MSRDPFPVPWDGVDEQARELCARVERRLSGVALPGSKRWRPWAVGALLQEEGLQRLLWPEEVGGGGGNSGEAPLRLTMVLETVGRVDLWLARAVAANLTVQALLLLDEPRSPATRAALCRHFCGTTLPAHCAVALPGAAGADHADDTPRWAGRSLPARALLAGRQWVVRGEDLPLSPGHEGAELLLLPCADPGLPLPALILVPLRAPGVVRKPTAGEQPERLTLDGVRLPEPYCLAQSGEALRALESWHALFAAAAEVGGILAQCDQPQEDPARAAALERRAVLGRLLVRDLARILAHPERHGPAAGPEVHRTAQIIAGELGVSVG